MSELQRLLQAVVGKCQWNRALESVTQPEALHETLQVEFSFGPAKIPAHQGLGAPYA